MQLLVRFVCPDEIADHTEHVARVSALIRTLDVPSTNALSYVFAWLPGVSDALRLYNGARVYAIISQFLQKRKEESRSEGDIIQYLIDKGDTAEQITSVSRK